MNMPHHITVLVYFAHRILIVHCLGRYLQDQGLSEAMLTKTSSSDIMTDCGAEAGDQCVPSRMPMQLGGGNNIKPVEPLFFRSKILVNPIH